MSEAVSAPEPVQPAPPAFVPMRRGMPGWGWGLIIAGTAIVALLIGGGIGFGTGFFVAHVRDVRSSSVQFHGLGGHSTGKGFGSGGMNGGGMTGGGSGPGGPATGKGGPGSGSTGGRKSPSNPATPIPTPNS